MSAILCTCEVQSSCHPLYTPPAPFSILLPPLSHWGVLCRPDLLMLPLFCPNFNGWSLLGAQALTEFCVSFSVLTSAICVTTPLWTPVAPCVVLYCSNIMSWSYVESLVRIQCNSWLCLLLPVWLWASYLIFQRLGSLIWKLGILKFP